MQEVRYTEEHEWVRIEEDGTATVGISDYAQSQLGDIVYIELPEIGNDLIQGDEAVIIESVKAAGEVKAPISGSVIEVNSALTDEPEIVNVSPLYDGWLIRIEPRDVDEAGDLMSEDNYQEYIEGLE